MTARSTIAVLLVLAGTRTVLGQAPKPAEPGVAARNRAVLSELPFSDRQDFDDAMRGFVATVPDARNPQQYQFLQGDAPPTVNPSLWRLAQLNAVNGLFKVVDGMYQVRGFSLANMTIVEGRTGLIVIDPLSSVGGRKGRARSLLCASTAEAGGRGRSTRTATATTTAACKGVTSDADVSSEARRRVFAPAGFMEAAVSESVIAGNAMGRRAQFQFGGPLPRGERGNVDAGLGKNDSRGAPGRSLIAPTDSIQQPVETRTIDGVDIVFHLAPASEAPAEMHLYFPQLKVLDIAENATHTLHNLLPLRGTEVRDAKGWSKYLGDALDRFGARRARCSSPSTTGPSGDTSASCAHLEQQRDLYKYVHDQSVRMMNQGMAPTEIAETLRLPKGLEQTCGPRAATTARCRTTRRRSTRSTSAGTTATRPTLNALPPVESARKNVEYMGGAAGDHRPRTRRLPAGQLPLGGAGDGPGRVCRPVERRGPRARG